MEIKTLVANNDLGTIQVRDTRDTLDVVEKVIAANDRKPAEIMLNVEIIEINRNKSDQLGINWGSQISVTPQGVAADATAAASGDVYGREFGCGSDAASSRGGLAALETKHGHPADGDLELSEKRGRRPDAVEPAGSDRRRAGGENPCGRPGAVAIGLHPGRDRAEPHALRISRHRHRARRDPEISPRQLDLRRPQCRGEFARPELRHGGGTGL